MADGDFTEAGGHAAMRALLESGARFSAVFCANDLSAMGALNSVLSSGRKVPLDLSIVGFDDVRLSPYTSPPLTTIHQPAAEIARHATELLLDLIRGEQPETMRRLFAPTLVVRGSTGPPRDAALDDASVTAYCNRLLVAGSPSTLQDPLHVGIIGVGRIGAFHARTLAAARGRRSPDHRGRRPEPGARARRRARCGARRVARGR